MVRPAITLGLFALLASNTLLAQFRPTPGGHGSVLFPGTGGPPAARPTYGGAPAIRGSVAPAPPAVRHPQHHPRTVLVPYPVYYGGGYYAADPSSYVAPEPAPAYARGYNDHDAPPPVIIINQTFRPDAVYPQIRDYSNVPLPPPGPMPPDAPNSATPPRDDTPSYYLLAMKDHSILAAVAYWVDADTLHYITLQGDQNRISLDLVDREFSKQLNADRRIELKLPSK